MRPRASTPRRLLISLLAVAAAALVVPAVFNAYWLSAVTTAAVLVGAATGLGLLYGRAGMVSLCQYGLVGVGAWMALRFHFAWSLPFPVLLLAAGAITAVIATLISLPALRLSPLYFALVSLMAAGGADVFFTAAGFPDGGSGILGVQPAQASHLTLSHPSFASSSGAFFRLALVVDVVLIALIWLHLSGRPGRAWAVLRRGEPVALSAGINVPLYRVWAVALAGFTTGVSGAMLAASIGTLQPVAFGPSQSIVLFAAVLVGGTYSLWGGILAAALIPILPSALSKLEIDGNVILILFGLGIVFVVASMPGGLAEQIARLPGGRRGRMRNRAGAADAAN